MTTKKIFAVFLLAAVTCGFAGPSVDVTGTWTGTLTFGSTVRVFSFQLHQRPDGQVLGYILGGTKYRVITSGSVAGHAVSLTIEVADPDLTRIFNVSGAVSGNKIDGVAEQDGATQTIKWKRTNHLLHERRFVFAKPDLSASVDLAVVLTGLGHFVSGGFVGRESCDLFACGGGVTSFAEAGTTITIGLETGGTCPATGSLTAAFDPATKLYSGSYTLTGCGGTTGGPILGARGARARSDDVAGMMAAVAQIADDLEAGATFAAPYAPFSSAYLHNGDTLTDRIAELNTQVTTYESIQVTLSRFRNAASVSDPDAFPQLVEPIGIQFRDVRVGSPPTTSYRDSNMETLLDTELRFFRQEGTAWKISGNQQPAFDLPFAYSLGTEYLLAPVGTGTPYAGTLYVSVGSWNAHFGPQTGHGYGDAKANLMGFYTQSDADLTDLGGGVKGFDGGPSGSLLLARRPIYFAPQSGKVTDVRYVGTAAPFYFASTQQWQVNVRLDSGLMLTLDHVGQIHPNLRDKILAAGGPNTDTYAGPPGSILGSGTIDVATGEDLAYPQVIAQELSGHPNYFVGGGGSGDRPWVQIEMFVSGPVGATENALVDAWDHLPAAKRASIQAIHAADMNNPNSQRFGPMASLRWTWAAEGKLNPAYSQLPQDFSSIHTSLGGWFERTTPSTTVDEIFAIAKVEKSTATYDPSLYHSPSVDYLVLRRKPQADGSFAWIMPDGSTINPFYPNGEVIELTSSSMLIKWRDAHPSWPVLYERAAYLLDSNGLKIRWGNFAATEAGALAPALSASDECNDTDTLCYDHVSKMGF